MTSGQTEKWIWQSRTTMRIAPKLFADILALGKAKTKFEKQTDIWYLDFGAHVLSPTLRAV